MCSYLIILAIALLQPFSGQEERLCEIRISGIRSSNGQLILAAFDSQEDFAREVPFREICLSKRGLYNGTLTCRMPLPEGVFGITLLDDEDGNGRMKYNGLGIPREGFGFSNFVIRGLRRPVLEDFDFNMGQERRTVHIQVCYI